MQHITLTVEYALKNFGIDNLDLTTIEKLIGKSLLRILVIFNPNYIRQHIKTHCSVNLIWRISYELSIRMVY